MTIATNMAGRGTDILLGGNAEEMTVEELMGFDFGVDATVVERILREANWELVDGIERGAERVGEPAEREGFPLMLAGLQELGIDITAEQLADIALKREQIGDKMAAMCRASCVCSAASAWRRSPTSWSPPRWATTCPSSTR